MTEKINPWIKGTLSRGRYFIYNMLCVVTAIVANYAIDTAIVEMDSSSAASPFWLLVLSMLVALITVVLQFVFMVKRLHDAGKDGTIAVFALICGIVAGFAGGYDDVRMLKSISKFAGIIGLFIFIMVCAEPTKVDNNPYKTE